MASFKFRVVLCRIRPFPTLILGINWLGSGLPLTKIIFHLFQNQVVVDRKMNILDLLTGEEDPQDYLEKLMADWDIWSASMKVKAVRKGHVTSVPPSYCMNHMLRIVTYDLYCICHSD